MSDAAFLPDIWPAGFKQCNLFLIEINLYGLIETGTSNIPGKD